MSYVLIEESLFRSFMGHVLNQTTDVEYRFKESDYWMNGKEVCEYMNISQGTLNAFRNDKNMFSCGIKGIYQYKRAEVYKMQATMDRELGDSGAMLGGCSIINPVSEALKEL